MRGGGSRRRRSAVLSWLLPLGVGLAAAAVKWLDPTPLAPLERAEYDFLLRHFAPPRLADPRIVLVLLDERSLQAAGQVLPSRSLHAEFTRGLREAGAERVVWDVLFERPTAEDAEFANAMRSLPTFLAIGTVAPSAHGTTAAAAAPLPRRFAVGPDIQGEAWPLPHGVTALLPQPTLLEAAAGGGHVMSSVDGDGILRRVPLVVSSGSRLLPSLALRAGLDALGVPPDDVTTEGTGRLVIGARTLAEPLEVPLDHEGNALVVAVSRWRRGFDVRSFEPLRHSVRDFPADMRQGLEGRTVVVGADYVGSGDVVAFPTEPALPGVVVTAYLLNSLLTGEFIHPAPRSAALALTLLAPLAAGLAFLPRRARFLALAGGGAGLAAASAALFRYGSVHLPVAVPLLALAAAAFLLTARAHAHEHSHATVLARVLERFVSPGLLRELERRGADALPRSVARAEVTVLFADVAGFTAFADRGEPEDVAAMLRSFYRAALDAVDRHGGTLDKLLGDGVLACWGAPDPIPDKERRALAAALDLHRAFGEIAREWATRGGGKLALRCGLTTSYVTAGYLGDERRATYTVVGRGVNLASRLQSAAEPGSCLLDARTAAAAGREFGAVPRGPIEVKGVSEPVEVFAVEARPAGGGGP